MCPERILKLAYMSKYRFEINAYTCTFYVDMNYTSSVEFSSF